MNSTGGKNKDPRAVKNELLIWNTVRQSVDINALNSSFQSALVKFQTKSKNKQDSCIYWLFFPYSKREPPKN